MKSYCMNKLWKVTLKGYSWENFSVINLHCSQLVYNLLLVLFFDELLSDGGDSGFEMG